MLLLFVGFVQLGNLPLEVFDALLERLHFGLVFPLDRLEPDASLLLLAELRRFQLRDLMTSI